MISVGIKVDGMREATELLDGLHSDIQEAILKKSLKAAAQPVVAAAQWNAPIRTGGMMKSLRATPAKAIDPNTIRVAIEPGDGWFMGRRFYAGYMEWGYTAVGRHRIRGGKRSRKRQLSEAAMMARYKPGRLFVTKAFDEKTEEASGIFYREIQEVARKRAERYARRQARIAKAGML